MILKGHKPHNFLINQVNTLVKILVASDMLIVGAVGMFAPLYALFVKDAVIDANELTIGVSISIYLFSRSILQVPLAILIDKIKGELDDYYYLVIFTMVVGLLHLCFIWVNEVWQLYLLQLLLGTCTAITYPSFMALFTRHVDRGKEGTEWGVYYTFVDISSAVLAALGGYIASNFCFNALIILVSVLCTGGGVMLIFIKPYLYKGLMRH